MKNKPYYLIGVSIKLLFISVSLILIAAIFMVFYFDYESFLNFLVGKYGLGDKLSQIKSDYLSPLIFKYLRIGLLIAAAIVCLSFILLRKKIPVISDWIYESIVQFKLILKEIKIEFQSLSLFQKASFFLLMAALLVFEVYCLFKFPLVNDEVTSYLSFVDKGFLVAASYYPAPNNHIFYSELCVAADLFFNDPLLVMRIPSVIASLLTALILFIYLKRKFEFESAFLAVLFFSFSYNIFYYSIHGRGYTLLVLLILIAFISLMKILENNSLRVYKIIFILSCSLGFYTIPVFLYPYLSLIAFGNCYFFFNKKIKERIDFFLVNSYIVMLVLFFYLPILMLNGLNALIRNPWVKPMSFENFWDSLNKYLLNVSNYLWNMESGGFLIILLILLLGVFLLFKRGEKRLAWINIFLLLLPLILLLVQKVQPFPRVWDYLMLFFSILIAVCMNKIFTLINNRKAITVVFLISLIGVFIFNFCQVKADINRGFPHYSALNKFFDQLFKEVTFSNAYVEEETYKLFMEFKSKENSKKIGLYDEPINPPDLIILAKGSDFPSTIDSGKYRPYIFNLDIHSFVKK